jgi:hypothetical protein
MSVLGSFECKRNEDVGTFNAPVQICKDESEAVLVCLCGIGNRQCHLLASV